VADIHGGGDLYSVGVGPLWLVVFFWGVVIAVASHMSLSPRCAVAICVAMGSFFVWCVVKRRWLTVVFCSGGRFAV